MGLNWDAAFRNAFETGAGLLADSITRDRNLADKQAFLALNDQMEQQKSARVQQEIINITGGVAREVDDPTHPEGKRQLSEQEYQSALASAFDKAGRPGDAELFQKRADRLRDDTRQEQERADQSMRWQQQTDIENKRADAVAENQKATNARLAANADLERRLNKIKLDETERQAKDEANRRGLRQGLLTAQRADAPEAANIYAQELAALGASPNAMGLKERHEYAKVLSDEARALEKQASDEMDPTAKAGLLRDAGQARKQAKALFADGEDAQSSPAAQDVRVGGVVIGKASSPEEAKQLVEKHLATSKKPTSNTAPAERAPSGIVAAPSVADVGAKIAEQQRIAKTSYVNPEVRLAAQLKTEELIRKRNAALGLPNESDIPLSMR